MGDDDVSAVIERELALLTPEVRGSADQLDELLDPDFEEIGTSGRLWTRAQMIAALVADTDPEQHTADVIDMRGRVIGPGFVLLTYVTQAEGRRARRSSLWRQSIKGWRVLHHQGTPAPQLDRPLRRVASARSLDGLGIDTGKVTVTECSAQRRDVLLAIAARVPSPAGADAVRVAVDGVDGSGKSVFADQLADVLREQARPVVRASVDDFHHPRVRRYRRGRSSPSGFWLDAFDYDRLRLDLLDPLGPGGSRRHRTAVHDLDTDRHLDLLWVVGPPGVVLVLDGLFLHRDELYGLWELSVFLDVPFDVTVGRMAARDGSNPDPHHPSMRRYVDAQRTYFKRCMPAKRADLVIDNSDWDRPALQDDC